MDPVMRIVLAVVGALFGATVGVGVSPLFAVVLGAFAGYALADLSHIRARLRELEADFDRLRHERAAQPSSPTTEPPPATAAEPVPAKPPASMPPSTLTSSGPTPSAPRSMITVAAYAPSAPLASAAAAPDRAQPHESAPPSLIDGMRLFFGGGNFLVRSGLIVLFFGIAFLLRYVAQHTRVPIELRLSGVAAGGLALLALGWRLRASRPGFALSLQGGAVGILYLTVFAALHLYHLLPPAAAFALLSLLAVLSALLAVRQDSQALALLGVIGGFLAPILASGGQGDHVVWFGYYAVLNAGIFLVSWFKSWRGLNLAGFGFTFGIGTLWGVLTYRPADFATTEPFLVLFFLFYVAIAVLFALRQPPRLRGTVDGTLVFGTPLAAFGLQALMLHEQRWALALSALAMSALYLGTAALLRRRRDPAQRSLIEAFLALGVVFATLAAPLALGSRWNAAAWALEGAGLVWIGCRQGRLPARMFGVLLLVASGCVLAGQFTFVGSFPILPWSSYADVLLVSGASIASSASLFVFSRPHRRSEALLADSLFWWGALWWVLGGAAELPHFVPHADLAAGALTLLSLTACAASQFHRRLALPGAAAMALAQLPIMLLFALAVGATQSHPLAHGGWLAWPAAFVCLYFVLYRHESAVSRFLAGALHVAAAGLLIALSSWEASWLADYAVQGSRAWPAVAWAIIPVTALAVLALGLGRDAWPLARHREPYRVVALGIVVALIVWSVVMALSMSGDVAPLAYLPLLNPLDIVQLCVLLALRRWIAGRSLPAAVAPAIDRRVPGFTLAALAFLAANASLLRTLHQWIGVPWGAFDMLHSTTTQAALSIFWATVALAAMLVATRRSDRTAWFAGAALIAATIAKLFLVDLAGVGSIERIVSFVGVGVLMLVIGYYSPIPPRAAQPRS
jgi:uncharacterized membrane protein